MKLKRKLQVFLTCKCEFKKIEQEEMQIKNLEVSKNESPKTNIQ
jgi:hypothetical protein